MSIRNLFYASVEQWDDRTIHDCAISTESLVSPP